MVDISGLENITKKRDPSPFDMVTELLSVKKRGDIDFKTSLDKKQINALTKLEFISRYFEMSDTLGLFCEKFKRLAISEDRKGRLEFIDAMKTNMLVQEQMKDQERTRQAIVGQDSNIRR
jgi:hypothetical protein